MWDNWINWSAWDFTDKSKQQKVYKQYTGIEQGLYYKWPLIVCDLVKDIFKKCLEAKFKQ